MLLHLTNSELLDYRLQMAGYEPANLDFTIERTDGINVDAIVANRLRRWYVEQLHTAPLCYLPVEDVAAEAAVTPGKIPNSCIVTLPDGCLRPQSISFEGWTSEVTVLPEEQYHNIVRAQDNQYLRASADYPVAALCPGRPRSIIAFPTSGGKLTSLIAVKDPGDNIYILDETLLNHLPADDIFNQL